MVTIVAADRPGAKGPGIVDVAGLIEGQRLSAFLVRLIVLSWVITFFDGFDIGVLAYVAPYLAPEFQLTKPMIGNLFSIGLVGTMAGGFLFGWIGDKVGRRPAVIAATAGFGVLTLAFAFGNSYAALLVIRLLDGVALGGMLPLCWALNMEYVPRRYRSSVVTVIMLGYSVGVALGGPVSNWLIPQFGWPAVYYFGGGGALISALLLLAALPESIKFLVGIGAAPATVARAVRKLFPAVSEQARFVDSDDAKLSGAGEAFRASLLFKEELRWITPLFWIAYICSSVTVFFLSTWSPLVFEAVGFTRADAASAASFNTLMGALGGLLLMRFIDRIGPISVTAMPLLAIPCLLVAGLGDLGHVAFLVFTALITLTVVGAHFGMHSTAGIFYPSAYRGNGAGWATSVAKVGSIAGPLLGGWLLSSSLPVRNIFVILAIFPAILAACVFAVGIIYARAQRRRAGLESGSATAGGMAGASLQAGLRS